MPINAEYRGPIELPEIIPVFPLAGALLLPRGQMPLNIFEQRYLAMVDDALRDSHRLIGMIQPDVTHSPNEDDPVLLSVEKHRRNSLVAKAHPSQPGSYGWDVFLQGDNETVFFDL